MKVPAGHKLEKLVSKDASRPVLCQLYLRIVGEGDDRKGFLEATDSYKLARIPVEVSPDDVEGFIPVDAVLAARKAKAETLECNGTVSFATGLETRAEFPRTYSGQWVNTDSLLDVEPALIDGERWTISFRPEFLLELAQGMGAEVVTLEFARERAGSSYPGGGDNPKPSARRPIRVTVHTPAKRADASYDATGLLMPVAKR